MRPIDWDAPVDPSVDRIVKAGVEAFKHATPEQVEDLRRLFAPLVKAIRAEAAEDIRSGAS